MFPISPLSPFPRHSFPYYHHPPQSGTFVTVMDIDTPLAPRFQQFTLGFTLGGVCSDMSLYPPVHPVASLP